MSQPAKRQFGNYTMLQEIGHGSFASVWLAEHTASQINVAIKVIKKRSLATAESRTRFSREVSLLKQLNHMFIADFFEFLEDEQNYGIAMEYVENGSLRSTLVKNGKLSEEDARFYFTQLISCLEYLHTEKCIMHRDLKLENVLLDRNGNIRVVDFGLSNMFCATNPKLFKACGSRAYVSPEMVQGLPYTNSADIWSAGVLLYALVVGSLPFDHPKKGMTSQMILYTDPHYPPFLSVTAVDLLRKMLCKNPENRITLDKIKEHPWFSTNEYMVVQQFRMQTARPKGYISREIVDKMKALGFNCQQLHQNLLNDEFTEAVAVYRMFLRAEKNDQMKNMIKKMRGVAHDPEPATEMMPRADFQFPKQVKLKLKPTVVFGEMPGRRGSHPTTDTSFFDQQKKDTSRLPMVRNTSDQPRSSRVLPQPAPVRLATKWMSKASDSRRTSCDVQARQIHPGPPA